MQNYKAIVEYDGTNYCGFQVQKGDVTIQGTIESALEQLFCRHIRVYSCGRTDAGVHAEAHVINFAVPTDGKPRNIRDGLNSLLPRDIVIKQVKPIAADFHAQYAAKRKTYEYRIHHSTLRSPLRERYATHVWYPLHVPTMRKALKMLEGKHDFRSFASRIPKEKNTVRTLYKATISKRDDMITIRLTADGFLYNMVRNIVGTLCLVGQERMSLTEYAHVFKAKDRKKAGPTAPPQGLMLVSVEY